VTNHPQKHAYIAGPKFTDDGVEVTLMTCIACGATVVYDPRNVAVEYDPMTTHVNWHTRQRASELLYGTPELLRRQA